MNEGDIKMPRTAKNRSKRGCAQERGKPSHARRGKELDKKKKEAQQRGSTRKKKRKSACKRKGQHVYVQESAQN